MFAKNPDRGRSEVALGWDFLGTPNHHGDFSFRAISKNPREFEIPGMGIGDSGSPKISSEKIPNPGDGDLGSFRLKNPQKIPN